MGGAPSSSHSVAAFRSLPTHDSPSTIDTPDGVYQYGGLTVTFVGDTYVSATRGHHILKLAPIADSPPIVIGSGRAGLVDGTAASAAFNYPKSLISDGRGNVFVADSGNKCVRVIGIRDQVTTLTTRTDGDDDKRFDSVDNIAVLVDNRSAFSKSSSHLTTGLDASTGIIYAVDRVGASLYQAKLSYTAVPADGDKEPTWNINVIGTWTRVKDAPASPWAVAIDPRDAGLWIATKEGELVYRPSPDSKLTALKIGKAEAGAVGDGPLSGDTAHFSQPESLICDSFGNLYVADTGHYRVRLILRPWSLSGGRVHTIAGNGAPGQTVGQSNEVKLLRPLALYVDDRFAVWLLDHHRIVTIQENPDETTDSAAAFGGCCSGRDKSAPTMKASHSQMASAT